MNGTGINTKSCLVVCISVFANLSEVLLNIYTKKIVFTLTRFHQVVYVQINIATSVKYQLF